MELQRAISKGQESAGSHSTIGDWEIYLILSMSNFLIKC